MRTIFVNGYSTNLPGNPARFACDAGLCPIPRAKILSVGAISINPCQDAKVLADWYAKFGFGTKEFKGGYYAQIDTAGGPLFFAIHPRKLMFRRNIQLGISVEFRLENFETNLSAIKSKGLVPDKIEKDPNEG